jgi:hypothetical protein
VALVALCPLTFEIEEVPGPLKKTPKTIRSSPLWIGLSQHPGHTHRLPRRVAVVQMQVAGGRGRHVERIILRHVLGQRSGSMGTRPERPLGRIEISLIGMASATGPGQARLRAQAISLSRPHLANDEAHALYHGYACSETSLLLFTGVSVNLKKFPERQAEIPEIPYPTDE